MAQEEQQAVVDEPPPDSGDKDGRKGREPASVPASPDDRKPSAADSAIENSSGPVAVLNNEIEIIPAKRLPYLDQGPVKAYAARMRGDAGSPGYFAMICEPHLIPRPRLGAAFSSIINPHLVRLIASGTVFWPPEQGRRYCFVYENTLGHPLAEESSAGMGWRPEKVTSLLIKPLIHVLLDLRDSDIIHGSIRPSNLFTSGQDTLDKVTLGECLSTPTGYDQPVLFETIERAMCDPVARGRGTFSDDLYAFGATLAFLMRKKDPLEGKSDKEIIKEKVRQGSYVALTGKERFTGAVLELLRGLLYDDPAQRWTLEEVMSWIDGQRLSPKQSARVKKAARPLIFNEKRYLYPSLLAMDLNDNQSEAIQIIDNNHLKQWLSRSVEDSAIENRVDQAIETSQELGRGPGYWDRLLCRLSIALDTEAPIRFKGKNIHPEGLPTAMAEALIRKQDIQPFIEVLSEGFILYWLDMQTSLNVDVGALVSRSDSCRAFLRQPNLGYGLERCIYFMDADVPCLSDKVRSYYCRTPEEILLALEHQANGGGDATLPIDRHIAAFLSVKDKKLIDPYWSYLNAEEYHRRIVGNINVLATVQKRERVPLVPNLSRRMVDMLEPVYERFHDRQLRKHVRKQMEALRDSGDLVKISKIIDDKELLQKDFAAFRQAMAEYQEMKREMKELKKKTGNPATFGQETGTNVAAIVSGVLASLLILGLSFIYFSQGGL